jgi:hypothetical protein
LIMKIKRNDPNLGFFDQGDPCASPLFPCFPLGAGSG